MTLADFGLEVGNETEYLRRAKPCILRRGGVRRDGRADDRGGDRDDDEGEDKELLPPLPAKQTPRPPHDGTARREAAVGGACLSGGSFERRGHEFGAVSSSDSGFGGVTV